MSPLALSLRLLQTQPDERLVQLARGGHEPAFEALVRRYRRPLLAYCRRLSVPDASSEDILQQALLLAWRALSTGTEIRDVRAWLYRIVHNVAISSTLRRAADGHAELAGALRSAGVEQLVEQRLAARDALAGLASLPQLQREVLLGTAVEGRSHEEVAGALGLTSGSVRGLIYRARATLRAAAAALVPAPLVDWALREHQAARGAAPRIYEALAGGGSAGVAGAVLKGGAIATVAGALAGTAALISEHPIHPYSAPRIAIASPRSHAIPRSAPRVRGASPDRFAATLSAAREVPFGAIAMASVRVTHSHSASTMEIEHQTAGGVNRRPHGDRQQRNGQTAQPQFSASTGDPPEHEGRDNSPAQSSSPPAVPTTSGVAAGAAPTTTGGSTLSGDTSTTPSGISTTTSTTSTTSGSTSATDQ
jgi:RNA polymerase sigma factor (sigma-70 family)